MRYMIISDIHGSESCMKKALEIFKSQHCDELILLGDILYHGPRNPIPEGHNPQGVVALLNKHKEHITACRGNCDAEVDQMLLAFPCLSDYALIVDNDVKIFATHGHLYTSHTFPKGAKKQIFLYGHTHLWELKKEDGVLVCNPGSITLPKENRPRTYAIYENKRISIYNVNGTCLATETL